MTTIFGLGSGVIVNWSKIFDHDHSQNLKIAVVEWSKLIIFDHDHGRNLSNTVLQWSNGRNWSILTIDHGQNQGCFGQSWSTFLTIDHGANSRVSWSWSVPYPPPPLNYVLQLKFCPNAYLSVPLPIVRGSSVVRGFGDQNVSSQKLRTREVLLNQHSADGTYKSFCFHCSS